MAYNCESWDDYQAKECNGDPIAMGDGVPRSANGTYFLETEAGPRFARFIKIN